MIDIAKLRNRKTTKSYETITKGLENQSSVKSYEDDRQWKIDKDKAGNGSAVIRFLDITEGDDLPWVRIWSHSFKVNGRWYIEKSLTSLKLDDPVSEFNTELWNESTDENSPGRKQARDQKRKLDFYSNILVVNDPKHPENNGKVFLYKYGKKIHDKITAKLTPEFEDEVPVNVFDYWEGANFRLRVKTVSVPGRNGKDIEFPNYDDSKFDDSTTPVADTDEEILEIAKKQYRLSDELDEKNFKSYDELRKRLEFVLNGPQRGGDDQPTGSDSGPVSDDQTPEATKPAPAARKRTAAPKATAKPTAAAAPAFDAQDDESAIDYFKKLTEGDAAEAE